MKPASTPHCDAGWNAAGFRRTAVRAHTSTDAPCTLNSVATPFLDSTMTKKQAIVRADYRTLMREHLERGNTGTVNQLAEQMAWQRDRVYHLLRDLRELGLAEVIGKEKVTGLQRGKPASDVWGKSVGGQGAQLSMLDTALKRRTPLELAWSGECVA